ncbi:hypothetical protein CANARDRAFT_177677 [[Candida] arabinofermentans NRRL YB-2248]|uniref:Uncharacterized protein n=1 Tax=[Candida] arabinofermentans NRRL YB-2248 TaxID=983967 RepID=A0A1E4SVK4_9ASCO|nr:hypothetical protein CANARDRAFT_177677 [[Candida] arabinofermentans NRRL YB-2248]
MNNNNNNNIEKKTQKYRNKSTIQSQTCETYDKKSSKSNELDMTSADNGAADHK